MMKIIETRLEGVFEIQNDKFEDHRGTFVKTFHQDVFSEAGLDTDFKESFYSISKKNVLRGMHYQVTPHQHSKLVYVVKGEILDVVVDLRNNSKTFGMNFSVPLSDKNTRSLYISKGFAHGFLTLSEVAIVVYSTSSVYAPDHDTGIKWDSFGFDWGKNLPIVSRRDDNFHLFDRGVVYFQ